MNILVRELQAQLKSLAVWCLGMIFLVYTGMIKYAGFADAGQEVNKLFENLPPEVKSILGMGELDISSIAGFYAVFYLYFMLLGGLHAIMLGAEIISREERDRTGDFLYAKPAKRSRIITSKLITVLINAMVLNLVILTASVILVRSFNHGQPITDIIIKLMLSLFILQLLFGSIGACIAALSENSKKAAGRSAAFLLMVFFISVAVDLYDKIDFLAYITPFKYFPAEEIIIQGKYSMISLLLSLILMIIFIFLTYQGMQRRDLRI